MADWTTLPNTAVGVGGLPSGTTVTALRDNPVAIAQGAAGAPRLYGKAAVPNSQQTELDVLSLGLGSVNVGDLHYSGNFVSVNTTSTAFQSGGTVTSVLMSGNVTARATQTSNAVGSVIGNTCEIRLRKNGVVIQTFSLNAPSGTSASETRSVNISVAVGDTFEWQVRRSGGDGTSSIGNQTFLADDAYTRIGIPIRESDL
jgi:hypothetical protein